MSATPDMKLLPYGPDALLWYFAQKPDESAFLRGSECLRYIERNPPFGLIETVPALTSLLLVFGSVVDRDHAAQSLSLRDAITGPALESIRCRTVELPVSYRGLDLERVARSAGVSVAEVIRIHSDPEYWVQCLGFAPGFPYLGGLDPRLHTPRLQSPRPRVPAGSVAIGGSQAGIYSIASPGGWNLLGITDAALFRPEATRLEDIFLLRTGDRVRFLAMGDPGGATGSAIADSAETSHPSERADGTANGLAAMRVLSAGAGMTFQDAGRPGFRRFGVPPSGYMDPYAAEWANRLLDNAANAPLLEMALQGQRLEVLESGWVAWTGNSGSGTGSPKPWSAFRVTAGEVLSFPHGARGVWSYLAVPGGFFGPRFFGSVSANPRAGIGEFLKEGMVVCRDPDGSFDPPSATASRRTPWTEVPNPSMTLTLPTWPGPQWDLFSPVERERFFSSEWIVSAQSDRAGYRLQGSPIRCDLTEIISEPVLPGTIQVPSGGQPIITMPDGPTLGGYPKLGVLNAAARAQLSQVRSGERVRFTARV